MVDYSATTKRSLVCMVVDIVEELLDLDMEPKRESLWWTNTYKRRGRCIR